MGTVRAVNPVYRVALAAEGFVHSPGRAGLPGATRHRMKRLAAAVLRRFAVAHERNPCGCCFSMRFRFPAGGDQ